MSQYSLKVYQAKDGYEAIENFQKNKIDVILCDINIPKLNGLDVVNNIRKANKDVVIIMVSAYSDSETLLKAYKLCYSRLYCETYYF